MMEYMQDYDVNADITDIAFYDHEQVAMHGIDLNVDPSELQQPNEGNVFSLLYQSTKAINHFIMWHID